MKHILSALLMGLCAVAYGQNRLSGTVSDGNNQPIAGASVYLPDLHKGTVSDAQGNFQLNALPSGPVRISVTMIGFKDKTLNVQPSAQPLAIILEENVHQMDEVIVSTAFNKLQSQNVMKVDHASLAKLQQQGVSTLMDGVATMPGVSQVSTGASIGKPVIRGLSGNRVLVYSQGVRMENQQFGDEHGLGLSDSGVESVEVIKGPASLLYGSDAMGGVLYFNPEKFADANAFKANVNQRFYSNTLGSATSVGVKGSTDNWKFLGRAGYATHSDYKIGDGDRVTNTRYNEKDLKAAVGYSNSGVSSVFRYAFNRLDLGLPEDGIGAQSTDKSTLYPNQAVDSHIASWQNTFFFGKSSVDANFGYIRNDRSEFEDSPNPALHMKLQTLNCDLRYHFPVWGGTQLIGGIQGMHQTNRNSGEEYLIPDAEVNDFGVYATALHDFGKHALQAGLRYDTRGITGEEHGTLGEEGYFAPLERSFGSFNASLGYKADLTSQFRTRLNLATGFRAPNLAELTSNGVHEGTNRYEIGNQGLENERNVQADLNLEFHSEHVEFFVNGFYNHINAFIYLLPTGEVRDENQVFAYTQANAALYGGEAGFHYHPHPLDWLHVESAFSTVTGKRDDGAYLPLIPANNWNNTLRAEFKAGKWLPQGFARINLSSTFAQDHVSGAETRSPGYSLLNAGLGGRIVWGKSTFDVSLNGNNILDKQYIAHLSRLKTDGIPNIGRNIVLGVNFTI